MANSFGTTMQNPSAMSPSGELLSFLIPVALDHANEKEIILSLHHLVQGLPHMPRFHFYHVIAPEHIKLAPRSGESFLKQLEETRIRAEAQLSEYVQALRQELASGVQIDFWIESREVAAPAEQITEYLQQHPFSLVIVTFHNQRRWEKFFGLTAIWDILESSSVPVLLLAAPLLIPPKRILWLTHMHEDEFSKLHHLIPLVRSLKATLYCAKINTPQQFYTHRTFQRYLLNMCDYIIENVDPDFIPEECLLYADKDLVEGAIHAAQDFLMDIVALNASTEGVEEKFLDRILSEKIPVLILK
ncbi:MAG: hypothetical protein NZ580_02560 [Bacteroidia bacterium]|nr:hypothetical protein [Bacteroidia bacterium]MDW8235634.1 hypothetical protein [Bacteroidia bacterium]